jgi:triosephosphate isomerase (TIM)
MEKLVVIKILMKPIIIAANWKMHKTLQEGLEWVQEFMGYLTMHSLPSTQVVLLPSFIHLESIRQLLPSYIALHLGAQDCHDQLSGAFTGEVSASMLASVGVCYVLVGHSERRQYCGESHELIARKIDAALQCNVRPIFCCGEPWEARELNQHHAYIEQQIADSLFHLAAEQIQQVIIAYEPVWAIGTGKTPDTVAIAGMQAGIRAILAQQYNNFIADDVTLLYGGSCNASNVTDFLRIAGINGVLVGNASLHVKDFLHMLRTLERK